MAAASWAKRFDGALDAAAKVYAALETARTASNSGTASGRRAITRLETYPWTLIEIEETAPFNAEFVRIALFSGVSGTVWFDGVEVEVLQ